jgi:hypothetical protein
MEVALVRPRRQVAELVRRRGIADRRREHRQVRQRRVPVDAGIEPLLVLTRVLDPLRIAGEVGLVGRLDRDHRAADLVPDPVQRRVHLSVAAGQRAHDDVRLDAGGGELVEAGDVVAAGGAEAVADVAHAELAQARLHRGEVPVGGVDPGEEEVHAHGVAEGARGLGGDERLRLRVRSGGGGCSGGESHQQDDDNE